MNGQNSRPLLGRRAVVTGAGKGIGRAIALALARAGADLAITARTSSDLDLLRADIQAFGSRCLSTVCDVTDPEQVRDMVNVSIAGLGGVDILVNNAGHAETHRFLDHPDELWHSMMGLNLHSVYYVCKAFVPSMVEQRYGRIINIASTAARVGEKYLAAYTAAKHGVLGLTRVLAAEFAAHGITANAICPGYVDTPMIRESINNIMARTGRTEEQALEALTRTNPQGRLVDPDEVAAIAVFLASDAAGAINGQAINIDGGGVQS